MRYDYDYDYYPWAPGHSNMHKMYYELERQLLAMLDNKSAKPIEESEYIELGRNGQKSNSDRT
jgi:hypothetical protein